MIQLGNSDQNNENGLTPERWNYKFSKCEGHVPGSKIRFCFEGDEGGEIWNVSDEYRTAFKLNIVWAR